MSAAAAQLVGIARQMPEVCTFATPVFRTPDGRIVCQQVDERQRIVGFAPISTGEELIPVESQLWLGAGAEAILAFEAEPRRFTVGTAPALCEHLAELRRHIDVHGHIGEITWEVVAHLRKRVGSVTGVHELATFDAASGLADDQQLHAFERAARPRTPVESTAGIDSIHITASSGSPHPADETEETPELTIQAAALALLNRGILASQTGDFHRALADYSQVLGIPDAPVNQVVRALINRAIAKSRYSDIAGALADYTAAIELPGAAPEYIALALLNRGLTRYEAGAGYAELAVADYTAVVLLNGATTEQVARALLNRAVTHVREGQLERAIADFTRVLELPGVPAEHVARALINRGIARVDYGHEADALADYTAAIDSQQTPRTELAWAINNRGVCRRQRGDLHGAIADYSKVIQMNDASSEERAKAYLCRGIARYYQDNLRGAAADYSSALQVAGAPRHILRVASWNLDALSLRAVKRRESETDTEEFGQHSPTTDT